MPENFAKIFITVFLTVFDILSGIKKFLEDSIFRLLLDFDFEDL